MFLATGERVAVPLADNAYMVEAARTKFPVRLVVYDDEGRVIGIEHFAHDPLARAGPRPVPGEQRVVRRVVGPNGSVAVVRAGPATDGGRCFQVVFVRGGGASRCIPKHSNDRRLALALQRMRDDRFLTGSVSRGIVTLRLHLPDGRREIAEPVEGFFLHPLPAAGLDVVVGLDRAGKEVARQRFDAG